jgi:signal transduction histidine kinase
MTFRVRLLSLTLSMVAIVAITLVALSLNSLTVTLLDVAISGAEMAGRQIQSFLLRRLPESLETAQAHPASLAATRDFWNNIVSNDADLSALLEQTMAQSRSIVEIGIANDEGIILASSNPRSRGGSMEGKQDLRALRDAGPVGRITAILFPRNDYETRVALGIAGNKPPDASGKGALYTIQILVSPVLLRAFTLPALQGVAVASGLALAAAFFLAYWSANLVLGPLVRIGLIIDDIVSGHEIPPPRHDQDARELAVIEAKLSMLGKRFRGAQEDATQLRSTLENALEKLDMGTRRQLESQIALARRLTAINSLTGGVAHEIKNPLNSIALRLEMLRSRVAGETPDDVDEQFAVLSSEVTRLDRVVRTFLDFSRPVDLNPERVDLAELVADVLLFIEPEAAGKGIRTSFIRPENPVVIEAGRDLLRQALLNIAVNAVEAMAGGGDLTFRIERSFQIDRNEENCVIVITDTGPGIPPDQLEKIFQLYYTTRPHGTGIGLAMAFRAAQLHGGTIEVDSVMGKGTSFRLVLPMAASLISGSMETA